MEPTGPASSSQARGSAAFIERLASFPSCAAVSSSDQFERAIGSDAPVLVVLRMNAFTLAPLLARAHDRGKLVAVHLDLVEGLRSDSTAVTWLAQFGADAVITSRSQIIPAIKREGMTAILRLLLLRAGTVRTGLAAVHRAKPDLVEILPGVILPRVTHVLPDFGIPLLAGGFIHTADDVRAILEAGAIAVTTSSESLWRRQ